MSGFSRMLAVCGLVAAAAVGLIAQPVSSAITGSAISPPSSMAATGDSFSVGFATGSGGCTLSCPEFSWTTGTAVNSHYKRLVALNPALTGHATNASVPGARIADFAGQV